MSRALAMCVLHRAACAGGPFWRTSNGSLCVHIAVLSVRSRAAIARGGHWAKRCASCRREIKRAAAKVHRSAIKDCAAPPSNNHDACTPCAAAEPYALSGSIALCPRGVLWAGAFGAACSPRCASRAATLCCLSRGCYWNGCSRPLLQSECTVLAARCVEHGSVSRLTVLDRPNRVTRRSAPSAAAERQVVHHVAGARAKNRPGTSVRGRQRHAMSRKCASSSSYRSAPHAWSASALT